MSDNEKQIIRKKVKKQSEKLQPLSLVLSLLFSLSVFYSYLDTYYEQALQEKYLFIICGIWGALMCLLFLLKDKDWFYIPLAAFIMGVAAIVFREELAVACKDIIEGFVQAYNSYMYVPLKISYVQYFNMSGFTCLFLLIHFWVLLWNVRWRMPLISAIPALGLIALGVVSNTFPEFTGTTLMTALFFGLLCLKNTKSWSYSLSITGIAALAAVAINFTLLPLYNNFTAAYSRPLIDTQSKIITGIKGGNTEKLMSDFLTGGGDESTLNDEEIDNKGKIMLTVTSNDDKMNDVYLRGFTGTEYTGFSWVASDESEFKYYREKQNFAGKALYEAQVDNDSFYMLTVKYVGDESNYVYTPYFSHFPGESELVSDSYLVKADIHKSYYDFTVDKTPSANSAVLKKYNNWVYDKYLDLGPLENSEVLADIVSRYRGNDTVSALKFIEETLSNYNYTHTPTATPKGEDYIEYFLGTSKEGYCQHFASASVMLCRFMGIPARYVTGYAIPGENFVETSLGWYYSVPDYLAHAWMEVYLGNEVGWVRFDFTPASALANPNLAGPGGNAAAVGDEGKEPGMNSPEIPYNHFDYNPEDEFIAPKQDVNLQITIDFLDFVPYIIGLVTILAVIFTVWYRMSARFEFYRVGRYDFSSDESRRLAISRNFMALEFCVAARKTDDDYSYMDYALSKFLDEEEVKLYKAVLQENAYGSGWSFDEKEVTDLMKKLRNKLIYSMKGLKQFVFLYIKCY